MSANLPMPHPEWSRLSEKYHALVSQIAAVIADTHVLADSVPVILGRYAAAFGDRLVRLQALEIEAARCKREIELLQSAINQGAQWDYDSIHQILEREFCEWQEKLNQESRNFQEQQGILQHLLDPQTTRALRDQFRVLARRLHPDLHPQQTDAQEELWHRVMAAYHAQDLSELDAIEVITRDAPQENLAVNMESLTESLQRMEAKWQTLLENLSKRRKSWPHDQLPLLDDPAALSIKQKELDDRIDACTVIRDQRRAHLNQILDPQ